MKKISRVFMLFMLLMLTAALTPVVRAAEGPLPQNTPSLSPDEAVARMKVPAGMQVTCFAAEPDVEQPVGFTIDDRGRIWVAQAYSYPKWAPTGRDSIVVLEDTTGDGKADKRTVFYDKLNYITGIEYGFGGVFVTSPPCLYFIPDKDGDLVADSEPIILLDGFGYQQSAHNIVSGTTYGPDGWLYGGHGGTSFSNLGKPGTPDSERIKYDGGVWRYHPIKHIFEPVCEGFTNPWGVDFDDLGQGFISNCVLPHLYHIIPGGHYDRRRESTIHKHVYKRMTTIADHLHYVGTAWDKSRGGSAEQLAAGGGHAHAGCMIYLGDALPNAYRGKVFMANIHGARLNMDILKRKGSGYTASHGPDFVMANDAWFRGITILQGPQGEVYFSDWHDTGECHSMKPDRNTGRIFRLTMTPQAARGFAPSSPVISDISKLSDHELVKLQLSSNEWLVRRARRLLQERAAVAVNPKVHEDLTALLDGEMKGDRAVAQRLRVLWALHVTGGLTQEILTKQLTSKDDHLRAWAIQLATESKQLSRPMLAAFEKLAREDDSPTVRLYLASACQRLPIEDRWNILAALAAREEDLNDANLPLMIWYALEPCVASDRGRALALVTAGKLPVLRQYVARRIASGN